LKIREVVALIRQQFSRARLADSRLSRESFRASRNAVALKEHVSVRVRPMPTAPNATAFCVCSGVSAFVRPRGAWLRAPFHQLREALEFFRRLRGLSSVDKSGDDFRWRGFDFTGVNCSGGSIIERNSPSLNDCPSIVRTCLS